MEVDIKLRQIVTMGSQDTLEEKTVTVCHGADFVNVNFINFCCTRKEIARVSRLERIGQSNGWIGRWLLDALVGVESHFLGSKSISFQRPPPCGLDGMPHETRKGIDGRRVTRDTRRRERYVRTFAALSWRKLYSLKIMDQSEASIGNQRPKSGSPETKVSSAIRLRRRKTVELD
uniref:PLC-beta PH domain-containing protein n=1 Tax=Anopheles maculatus TaxID=74869 RepID=A0A182SW99_9DIPT